MQTSKNDLLHTLLTIPEAQVKILDIAWQSAFYNVFHQTRTSRLLHALCMAPIVLSMFVLVAFIPVGGISLIPGLPEFTAINGAFAMAILFGIWYLAMDIGVGLVSLPLMVAFWLFANAMHMLGGPYTWAVALGVLIVASLIQTISHQPEQVPPPHSGTDGFKDYEHWIDDAPLAHKAKVMALFPVFTLVETISSPRLFAVQLLRLMHKFGYKKDLEKLTRKRAQRVLETGDYDAYYTLS